MNYAKLEVLGITVPIGENEYHDDGYVDSLIEHEKELDKKYGFNDKRYQKDIFFEKTVGHHYTSGDREKTKNHIYYLRLPTKNLNILNRAHEETHALDSLGKINILAEKLLKEQNVKIDFEKIDNREVIAELGSLYAAHSKEISPLKIWLYSFYLGDNFALAKRLYRKSKLPKKEKRINPFKRLFR